MAYVLGFFTADGNMIKNKRGAHFIEADGHRLCFSIRDSLRLCNFMYMNSDNLFLERKKHIFEHYFRNAVVA